MPRVVRYSHSRLAWISLLAALCPSACSSASKETLPMSNAGAPAQPAAPETAPPAPDASVDAAAAGASAAPPVTPPRAGTGNAPQPSAAGMNAAGPAMSAAGTGMPVAGSAGSPASAGTGAPPSGSMLPMISDPGAKGPFEIQVQESLEGLNTHIAIAPRELGRDGIKHPILVWSNGAGATSSSYRAMLDNVAAHGFFLLDDKQSSFESQPEVDSQRTAIDWAIAQAAKQGGPYFGKLDTTRIGIAGHSLGSVSTFGNVKDTRIKTSIHMAGGITGNPEGVDDSWLANLHAPTAFLCGDRDTNGLSRVKNDFAAAPPTVPLFFGLLAGVGHTDEFSKANGGRWGRIVIAWLRWQLAGDESFARAFVGPDCEFCKGDWTAMKHALD